MRIHPSLKTIIATSLFMVLLVPVPAYAQIYRWVDDKGVIHFSDRPVITQQEAQLVVAGPSPDFSATSPEHREIPQGPSDSLQRIHVPLSTILSPRESDRLRKNGIDPDQLVPLTIDPAY